MASIEEVRYHRSFLSPFYWDNFNAPDMWEKIKRTAGEIETIRLRDPRGFETTRKSLAAALKVRYWPGAYVKKPDQFVEGASHWQSGEPSDAKVAEVMKPTYPLQTAIKNPTTDALAIPHVPLGVFNAYVDDQPLHPVKIFHKFDQQFEDYATPFESVYSNLVYPFNRGFTPIIDNSYQVIGHFGEVVGGPPYSDKFNSARLLVSRKDGGEIVELEQAMAKGAVMVKHAGIPSGWADKGFFTSEHKIEVRTGLDGEVISFQVSNKGYLVQPWYSPVDIYVAGKIVVKLTAKIGTAIASSLMRRATAKLSSRAALNGATEALAKDGIKALAKDEAKAVVRELAEADLVPLVRKRGASRVLTPPEMETFLKDVLSKKPWLARLRLAHRLEGKSLDDALMKILQEWKDRTGKLFLPVNRGSVKLLGSSGEGGWALDKVTGKEVLIIEREAVNNSRRFLTEVTHELSYEAVRGPSGLPALNADAGWQRFSMDWLERVIRDTDGARVWGQLLRMGK